MSTFDISEVVAAEHRARLHRRADSARLAAAVRCCRPSTWTRAARRAAAAVSRLRGHRGASCCTPA
ncbi:hypothetical protein [Geodermatophilus sp. SYSU D00815]